MEFIILMAGLTLTVLGYRLFCSPSKRIAVTLAGALVAMLGATVSVVEARTLARHRVSRPPAAAQRSPGWRNGSYPSKHSTSARLDII